MKSWPVAHRTAPPRMKPGDQPDRPPWGITEILVVVLIALVLLLVVSLVNSLLLSAFGIDSEGATGDELGGPLLLMGQALLDFAIVGTAAYFSLRKYRLSPRAWGLRRERPVHLVACVGVLLASFAVLAVYGLATRALGLEALEPKGNVPEGFFEQRKVLPFTVFLVLMVAPTMEEMFFRGFLFGGFRRHLGMAGGAAASGLLFGSIHINGADTIGLVIPFSIIGFLFAMLAGRTGSIWNAILVHFAFNLIGFIGNLSSGAFTR